MIYLAQPPAKPMLSTVAVPLHAPIAFGADDSLVDTSFPGTLRTAGASAHPSTRSRAVRARATPVASST